jgi:threonine dehydrogenase-like Zn-dependent dehydrogenase
MQCLWLEDRKLSLRTVARPEPAEPEGDDDALIRVRLAGICGTDLELVRGYYPYTGIPGHEFVGEVVESPGTGPTKGLKVVGEINAWCGECETCKAGRPTHCEQRTVLGIVNRNGAFAEYLTLPARVLHPVPDGVDDEAAVFCEPLAAALRILEQVSITSADRVTLVGAGRLGQLIAQVLSTTGAALRVVARYPRQREVLEGRGIKVVDPADLSDGSSEIVVEATGSPDGFTLARRLVRPGGEIVLKSTYRGEVEVDFSALVVDEITLVGSRCGPFDRALQLLSDGTVDPTPLVETRYPLSKGIEAFEHAARRGAFKVLLDPSE